MKSNININLNNPLVSVIVPIYMIEKYVGMCIESILKQTYSNIEIILVDDGSKDRCPEICDLYATKDRRIKVIHKKNGGLVSARKVGLLTSHGEYISYVDGDDWIEPDFIETLCFNACSTKSDIVCAGQTRDLFTKSTVILNHLPVGVYDGDNLTALWKCMISYGDFYSHGVSTYVWNKLFKREVLIDTQLSVDDNISIGEDGAVTYPALIKCSRVSIIDNTSYHYRQREDSMLKQTTSFAEEKKKLKYLFDFLTNWSNDVDCSLNIRNQVIDYLTSLIIMRSGGIIPEFGYSAFDVTHHGKKVIVYSAGTFGQQVLNRFKESAHCEVVACIDDDYWEYRRCCLNVDPVDIVKSVEFDCILVATVNPLVGTSICQRMNELGIDQEKILLVSVPDNKINFVRKIFDLD